MCVYHRYLFSILPQWCVHACASARACARRCVVTCMCDKERRDKRASLSVRVKPQTNHTILFLFCFFFFLPPSLINMNCSTICCSVCVCVCARVCVCLSLSLSLSYHLASQLFDRKTKQFDSETHFSGVSFCLTEFTYKISKLALRS